MSKIKQELNILQDTDIYSLMLFILYKVKDIKEYSTLSELAYILDKESLLKLCEYFGGLTITIPTIDELKLLINAMLMYQYINIDGETQDAAIAKIGISSTNLRKVKVFYNNLCNILCNYTISR